MAKELLTLEEAKSLAIERINKLNLHLASPNSSWKAVENRWFVSRHFNISGLNGTLRYTFIKPLPQPILVKFSGKGAKWAGWIHCLYLQDGFTNCNLKDIHAMTLQFSCEAIVTESKYDFMPNGYYSGWHRGLSKVDEKKFKGIIDLNELPDFKNNERYVTITPELSEFKAEERASRYNLSEERRAQIKKRQIEIFAEALSKL